MVAQWWDGGNGIWFDEKKKDNFYCVLVLFESIGRDVLMLLLQGHASKCTTFMEKLMMDNLVQSIFWESISFIKLRKLNNDDDIDG